MQDEGPQEEHLGRCQPAQEPMRRRDSPVAMVPAAQGPDPSAAIEPRCAEAMQYGSMEEKRTFADIVAEVEAEPGPTMEVCAGAHNEDGDFFDPAGNRLERVRREITPKDAKRYLRNGAQLAWEACGCGGWSGCVPSWIAADVRRGLADGPKPRFVDRHDAPTWIDLWRGPNGSVVYAHGDVEWGDALL